ncbi:MAG: dihydrolipoyl dehydrogenase [Nitrososphaerota archaeon]|nr:dihydrolipoyl dehydrogenase [Nitrososphaerota archaeon]MDG6939753.1 dihydrolipoyl dehydrogenase [Nitrososphaerota archaeon]
MTQVDLVVIGGGPGGYVCAIRASQLGLKTAVVEKDRMGGECLNYGCIPSKSLVTVSKLYDRARSAEGMGVKAGKAEFDLAAAQGWKQGVVDTLVSGIERLCRGYGVSVVRGKARVEEKGRVTVEGGGEEILAGKMVIATGSRPAELPGLAFDGKRVISSREALGLRSVPRRILIVGGGVIGMETATIYQKLGSEVTVVELTDQLLPGTDGELVRVVQRGLEGKGVRVYTRSRVLSAGGGDEVRATVETPEGRVEVTADKVVLSVGRRPVTEGLNLEKLGVATDGNGFIVADGRMRTSVEGIYAIGDVRGPPMLAHKASREGIVAAEVAAGLPSEADWKCMPETIFTDPEIASAGLRDGPDVRRTRFSFAALGRALAAGEAEGFVKVISDAGTGLVLGVHIVGADASNLIGEAALAIQMGATVQDIAATVHPHPTLPEALMEAAEVAAGRPIHQLRLGGK